MSRSHRLEGQMSERLDDYEILKREVCELHERWNLLDDLFSAETTTDVLDQCAPAAFQAIFRAFVDLVIVGITRLATDNDSRTLTLANLERAYRGTELGDKLAEKLKSLREQVKPLKLHRDKRIAHHDADVAGSPSAGMHPRQLPAVTKKEIEDALREARAFMNEISRERDGTVVYYERILSIGDGTQIVQFLRDGIRLHELRRRAWTGSSPEELADELRKHKSAG